MEGLTVFVLNVPMVLKDNAFKNVNGSVVILHDLFNKLYVNEVLWC